MTVNMDKSSNIKALGIQWNVFNDYLQYSVPPQTKEKPTTKRIMLSNIAQILDPLGLINPVIVISKILIQELWQCKLDWNKSIPIAIHTAWKRYQEDLQEIRHIKIPRRIFQ